MKKSWLIKKELNSMLFFLILSSFLILFYFQSFALLKNILMSFLFFIFLILPGFAILFSGRFSKLRTIERFCFSFGISMFLYGILVIFSIYFFYPINTYFNLAALILINLTSLLFIVKRKTELKELTKKNTFITLILFFLSFIIFLQSFVYLPFRIDDPLPDGPYVFKNKENLHIKIQSLTGNLPADNFVPFVFSQFLLRKISFRENRPMLPGQEVSNRTVLMGLNATFFQSIFAPQVQSVKDTLPKYLYLEHPWPDVGSLGNDNNAFSVFLNLGIVLNSIFLFAIFLIIKKFFGSYLAISSVLFFMLFPYTINQVIFTWPKFLMAYFLILSLYAVTKRSLFPFLPIFLALAYHSHPSAIIYILFIGLYWLVKTFDYRHKKEFVRTSLKMALLFMIITLPWFIWTKFIIKIPSDLISQNLISDKTSFFDLLKIRLENLKFLFIPFFPKQGILSQEMSSQMSNYFPGAVGVYIIFAYYYIVKYSKKYFWEISLLAIGPIVLLIAPWGKFMGVFAILFAHPSIPLFFAFSFSILARRIIISIVLLIMQIFLSLYVLWFENYKIAAQREDFNLPNHILAIMILLQFSFILGGFFFLLKNKSKNKIEKTPSLVKF